MCRLLTDRQEAPRARTEPSRDLAQVNLLFAFSSGLLLSPPFNIFQFLSILPHLPKSQQLHLACACFKRMFSEWLCRAHPLKALLEKDQSLMDYRESVEILQIKVRKLEQLVLLKDKRIEGAVIISSEAISE
jgi:hypothetical protein